MINKFNFKFKNTGDGEFNDVIYPGYPFYLQSCSYKFTISPKTAYWRFGFRFSKYEMIDFVKEGDRHLQNDPREYRDIHISVGNRSENQWTDPNLFYLTQYNNNIPLLANGLSYKSNDRIELGFEYHKNEGVLMTSFKSTRFFNSGAPIFLDPEYKYFKVFAWADGVGFELDCSFEIHPLNKNRTLENNLNPFRVGNIIFRIGDMFDPYAQNHTNIVLLPASSYGSVTASISDKAFFLGLPKPKKQKPGTVLLFKPDTSTNFIRAGYAYSVDGNISNENLINITCENIYKAILGLPGTEKNNAIVNLPLLGTGAGSLDPVIVAHIYDSLFNRINSNLRFLVNIQSESIFMLVRNRMLGKLSSLEDESLHKPEKILNLERILSVPIDYTAYRTDKNGEVTALTLSNISLGNFDFIWEFSALISLSLQECEISDFLFLIKLKNLFSLSIFSCKVRNIHTLAKIKPLALLRIDNCEVNNFEFLSHLNKLESLTLANCNISNINFLFSRPNLKFLDLSHNQITNISPLSELTKLSHLLLSYNRIRNIDVLSSLNNLAHLDISYNSLTNLEAILKIISLNYLKANSNPYFSENNLGLNDIDNQLTSIKNLLLRQNEDQKQTITLPAKVLLLGNHASGKSSLLKYIQTGSNSSTTSTHIIRIQRYFKPREIKESAIPDAIFFDFGGQDYYHGIYRAFLSTDSVYIILWNEKTNKNKQRQDSNNIRTQDFSLNYWLCQKKYIEEEINNAPEEDPVILIQTHADEDKRQSFNNFEINHSFENEFYVSLKPESIKENEVNKYALEYLKASVISLIHKKQKKRQEPEWYISFLTYILKGTTDHKNKSVSRDIVNLYQRNTSDKMSFLKDDLLQFHKQGLILYYDTDELKDYVWLNPVALVEHIHNSVLTPEIKKGSNGRVPLNQFENVEPEILKLLCAQKVIFKHDFGANNESEYIIPNFLPLISEDSYFPLLTFDFQNPFFTLKFKHFLPFGLINQMICYFGRLEDQKKFWRDTLLFTFKNKARILIHLDFEYLEIKVSGSFLSSVNEIEKEEIKTYLFYSIMALYWDSHKPLPFETFTAFYKNKLKIDDTIDNEQRAIFEACRDIYLKKDCRPLDLYISINSKDFVNYWDICSEESSIMVNVKVLNENKELVETSRVTYLYPFKLFTSRALQKQQKVVISYSKRDLELIHKFQNYLSPLLQSGLIEEPWYCTELIGGREWNKEIQHKFDEADIIFFMISDYLMSTKYVVENEIKNAIDRWDRDKSVKIVPILLVPYDFQRTGPYNLGRFTGFPYMLRPVTLFKNQNSAWSAIYESIKIMITKDLFPDSENDPLNNELKTIFEKIVDEKWD